MNLNSATITNTGGTIANAAGALNVNGTTVTGGAVTITGAGTMLLSNSTITGDNRFVISYAGGTNSNDIVLTVQNYTTQLSLVSGDLVIQDVASGGQHDTRTIKSNTTTGKFEISDPNRTLGVSGTVTGATVSGDQHTVFVPFSSVAGNVRVNTLGGNDSLTVDMSLGLLSKAVTYDGGTQASTPGDSLTLTGGTFATSTLAFTNNSTGTIDLAGNSQISFTGLEPIVTTGTTIDDLILTINGGTGDDTVNSNADISFAAGKHLDVDLQNDDLSPGIDVIKVGANANIGFEQVHLRGNTQVAIHTVTGGSDGIDSVVFNSVNVAHGNAALSIDTGANSDSISFAPLAGPVAVSLTARGSSDGFSGSVGLPSTPTTFTNVDVLTGSAAAGNTSVTGDLLTMALDTATTWNLTGGDAGTVQVAGPARSLSFTSFENLTGANTKADTFLWGVGAGISGVLDAREGSDRLDYSSYGAAINVDLTAGTAANILGGIAVDTIGSSTEHLYGGNQADSLTGDADVNIIRGNDGADVIDARAGEDDVDGGAGNDILNVAGTPIRS